MEPLNARFGGGVAETAIHPIVLVILALSAAVIIGGRIRYLIVPFMLAIIFVPFGQVLVVGGMHFTIMRIIIIIGLLRCALSRRWSLSGGVNPLDKAFFLWATSYAVAFTLLYMEPQALVNRLGFLLDAVGGYYLLRLVICNIDDTRRVIKVLVLGAMVMSICMITEHITKRNIFAILGGLNVTPDIRGGVVRAQGAFQHSLLAGTFGATSLPLFVGLWRYQRSKYIALVGIVAATSIVVTAVGSTPVVAYLAGIVGLLVWPLRTRLGVLRWSVVGALIALDIVMKAPVWALIARIDLTGSSSSYHRYELVDNFIKHFSDWWLIGTKSYDKWGFDMWDTSNQYIEFGTRGGLLTVVAFLAIIWLSFRFLRRARARVSRRDEKWLIWCLGTALFAHTIAYVGISYFDQMQVVWYALLAMISATAVTPLRRRIPQCECDVTVKDICPKHQVASIATCMDVHS